ncbi:DUF3526 domain-containing protein [Aquimarina sp. U1-2]|uniref:DUF3526 domain-containing protein n=1 Tax=Aquimarina sp. U1-2 TaxID=2823141 RepID=UPI001AECB724|nr:DUF3526 domain-containing protein [Aquimarina sp. U1-2]MBP2830863.1 DUF3526 domain-containing protein [Aquimarina sp. U1-2]
MLSYNFKYELKLLLRSKWIQLLSIILLLLFGFSGYNGKEKVAKRKAAITAAQDEVKKNDEMMLQLLDSIEKGMQVSASRWTLPTSPMAVGNYHPRVAAMESQSMAFIATGQADLFTHYVKPKVSGDDAALNFTEMTSPVQLLFGSFDLAFVIVYLLPLLIIAFSYDILSAEKESGSLRLLASQPIGIQNWVLQKLSLRFLWLSVLVIVALVITLFILEIAWFSMFTAFMLFISIVLTYMLFWFALAFLVNLWVGSSAKNAISLLGLWVLFVLLIPSTLNQVSTTLHPMPSRTLLINEMRGLKAEVAKKQDKILDNFLRDHPEYAINDTTQTRGFYHRYMASQQLVKGELKPVITTYENQLQKQQAWVEKLKWASPAITVQESLNKMAGTSTGDYDHFRKQVVVFAETWRSYLTPFLYNNQNFTQKDYPELPQFVFLPKPESKLHLVPVILLGITTLLFGIGYISSKKFEERTVLTSF